MTIHTVVLGPDAFRVLMMAALEAYSVPHGANVSVTAHTPLETTGAIWGTVANDAFGNLIYQVQTVDVDTSANMQPTGVKQKYEAIALKQSFTSQYSPTFDYLGDFHSHPWSSGDVYNGATLSTAQNAEFKQLYRFSGDPIAETGDYGSVSVLRKGGLNYRVGLVITIFKMKYRVANELRAYLDCKSAIRMTFNSSGVHRTKNTYRIWIKAYIFADAASVVPQSDEHVHLQCATAGFYGND